MRRNLIVGVGIVLLLVAFAAVYPSIRGFSGRVKLSQSIDQLEALAAAEEAYFHQHGGFVGFGPVPDDAPGSDEIKWDLAGEDNRVLSTLRWNPKPPVYCRFGVAATEKAFTAEMECDPEDSGEPVYVGVVRPADGQRDGIAGPFGKCPTVGVISSKSIERMSREGFDKYRHLPGACDQRSGQIMGISQMTSNKP